MAKKIRDKEKLRFFFFRVRGEILANTSPMRILNSLQKRRIIPFPVPFFSRISKRVCWSITRGTRAALKAIKL